MKYKTDRKVNTKNFLLFVTMAVGTIIILVVSNIMPWDPEGILAGFIFFGILALAGFLIEKLGIGKYFGEK